MIGIVSEFVPKMFFSSNDLSNFELMTTTTTTADAIVFPEFIEIDRNERFSNPQRFSTCRTKW